MDNIFNETLEKKGLDDDFSCWNCHEILNEEELYDGSFCPHCLESM